MHILKLLFFLFPITAFAVGDINTTIDILAQPRSIDTTCATAEFKNALAENAHMVPDYETASEQSLRDWVYTVFQSPATLGAVLACPEIVDADDNATLRFETIGYTFPNGREIVVNYETQPKVLHQRFLLATKTELPPSSMTDPDNPEVSSIDPHATWTNTDPAWYGIMVVQSGALRDFVGPNKNNVVSSQYIMNNIGKLYPHDMNGMCSTRSGIHARLRNSMVHKVMHEHTAKHPDDDNNYYVAGDINLHWISFAEIALDVVLTVVSWGGYAAASVGAKAARAALTLKKIAGNMKTLVKLEKVQEYIRMSVKVAKYTKEIDNINDMRKYITNIDKLEKALEAAKGTKQYEKILKELEQARKLKTSNMWKLGQAGKDIDKVEDLGRLTTMAEKNAEEIAKAERTMAQMAKQDKNVAEYVRQFDALKDTSRTLKELHAFKNARTGNMFVRGWKGVKNIGKTLKAANTSTKTLDRASRTARHATKSGRVRDWLFHSTMKNAGRLARVGEDLAALTFVLGILGDFYDWAKTETDEFTNGIKMKPLMLLSADNIEGQDNIVNYGMWLMWSGDSTSEEDDDAAYLQAMDFAQKFHQDLMEVQEEDNRYACDVDIYVVRPIIRNPGTETQSLYWLFMNDIPWTTATK